MLRIAIIGTGYVGLVSGTLLSDFGHNVICVDNNVEKINSLIQGIIPIFEPGLDVLVEKNVKEHRLVFATDIKMAVENSDVIFIAVGTPPADDGSADLSYVLTAASDIAANMNGYKVIVDKSTVPIGTGKKVKMTIQSILNKRGVDYEFDVVSNPEFLREGSAVYDFSHPDRVVIGAESDKAFQIMREVYRVLYINEIPAVETNIETAEMIKYASNAFLAVKITFINEIANICEAVGADVKKVAKAMGQDGRIGSKFLHAGPGYGGSCFPKDTKALANIARSCGEIASIVETTVIANENQKIRMAKKMINAMGDLKDKKIAVLGITFKPNTDDMRDAPALTILPELAKQGAELSIFDPQGEKEGFWRLNDIAEYITFCGNEYDAIKGSDAILILTEWNQFRSLDFNKIKEISNVKYFFDFRNIYKRLEVELMGFKYYGVGV
jgi:UDPglucose 6-dehydrogenase